MENKLIEVRNRDAGSVGYSIPDRGIWRSFAPGFTVCTRWRIYLKKSFDD